MVKRIIFNRLIVYFLNRLIKSSVFRISTDTCACSSQSMNNLVRCLNVNTKAKVYQLFDKSTLRYFTQKIVFFTSHQQLIYHHLVLTEISTEHSLLRNISSGLQISLNTQKLQMVIISPFMNRRSTSEIIKSQRVNCQTIGNLMIAQLSLNLLDELLMINRPYFPTCQNIYLYNKEVTLNQISFVGVGFIGFKVNIPKVDFLEICSILPAKMLNGQADYVLVKQSAILVFILSLIFLTDENFLNFKEMSDILSVDEAKILLEVQRQKRKKYFSNSKIVQSIKLFQQETGMNISRLLIEILIDEEEMSWPSFVFQLFKPKVQHLEMQANLEFLAEYHWNQMNKEEKAWLIKIKYVSIKQDQEGFDKNDTDFMMMRLTKTRFSLFLNHSCLSTILMNQTSFDMISYKLWINILKTIPFDNSEASFKFLNENQSKKQGHQCHSTNANGVDSPKSANQSNSQPISKYRQIGNLPFLIQFASKRLRNIVKKQQKTLIFEHSQLKAFKEYQSAFR